MEDNIVHAADQLESLSAQPPTAIDDSHASPIDAIMKDAHQSENEVNVMRSLIPRPTSPNSSELTDVDDALLDEKNPPPESQLAATATHFIDPVAPRVSYHLSPEGVVTVSEEPPSAQKAKYQASPRSPATTPSFERYASQHNTPRLLGSPIARPTAPPNLAFERIMGSKNYIPAKIFETLEDWHAAHPGYPEHPCAIKKPVSSTWDNFKVFDEDAGEYGLTVFRINVRGPGRKNSHYHIMVLYSENGPGEIVTFEGNKMRLTGAWKGAFGIYLLAWSEAEAKWENEVCAIKVWRSDQEDVIFQVFDGSTKPGLKSASTPSKAVLSNPDLNAMGKNNDKFAEPSSPVKPLRLNLSKITLDQQAIKREQTQNEQPRSSTISVHESHTLGSPFTFSDRQTKRIKHSTDGQDTTQTTIPAFESKVQSRRPLVRFQLVSIDNVLTRYFDADDARTFFKKVREFFHPTPAGVLCTYPGLDGVRYIGVGCVDEFDILLDGVYHSSVPVGEDRVVVVKPSVSS